MLVQNQIINNALEYIQLHILENVSVDQVAAFCGYSKFYLERIFKSETGESIYSFIKRMKVEQSAFRLKVEKQKSVSEICTDYGYSSSNYATLFKDRFGKSPARFRKNINETQKFVPFVCGNENELESFEECQAKIQIKELPDYFVLYERFKGNYASLEQDWCGFLERNSQFITENTILIERTNDDPDITDKDSCFYDICMTIDRDDPRISAMAQTTAVAAGTSRVDSKPGLSTMLLSGGLFAVYHYIGKPQQIYRAFHSVLSVWLAKSSYVLDNRYSFDIYKKIDKETMLLDMEICIPIKKG